MEELAISDVQSHFPAGVGTKDIVSMRDCPATIEINTGFSVTI
jgi:hypothetical protein